MRSSMRSSLSASCVTTCIVSAREHTPSLLRITKVRPAPMLERRGIISGYEGSKPRRVLIDESQLTSVVSHD